MMLFFLTATCFFTAKTTTAATLLNCECGLSNTKSLYRVVGGTETDFHEFPWLAVIYIQQRLHCGATLINNKYVTTAGHCVKWFPLQHLTVGLGKHDRLNRRRGVTREISARIVHKHFTSDAVHDTNDIALVKMKKPVVFGVNIAPACLPHPLSDYAGHRAIVAGWGRTSEHGPASVVPKKGHVQIMKDEFCLESAISEHYADAMLCAYGGSTDACQGDSGGPLLYERHPGKLELIGVISWGIGCAAPETPGIYTKVQDFLTWIENNTQDAAYCKIN